MTEDEKNGVVLVAAQVLSEWGHEELAAQVFVKGLAECGADLATFMEDARKAIAKVGEKS